MKSFICTGLFLLLFAIGCTSDRTNERSGTVISDSLDIPEQVRNLDSLTISPAGSQPSTDIQFEEEQEFGEQYLPNMPTPAMGIGPKVDVDNEGRVFMADRTQKTIHVYNPDGSELAKLGREGRGPGEFIDVNSIDIYGDMLMAYDANLARVQIFSLKSLQLEQIIKLNSQSWSRLEEVQYGLPKIIHILSDSTFLAGFRLNPKNDRTYTGFFTLDYEGKVVTNKIIELVNKRNHQFTNARGTTSSIRLPFSRKSILHVSENGQLYQTNTGNIAIKIHRANGTYRRAIYYPFENDPLEEDEVLENYDPSLHSNIREANFPQTWPALESIMVDDENRIWISTIVDDKEIYEWLVLNSSGELLATFTWPREEDIETVRDGKMYVSITDYEAGVKRVFRYGIEMKSHNH